MTHLHIFLSSFSSPFLLPPSTPKLDGFKQHDFLLLLSIRISWTVLVLWARLCWHWLGLAIMSKPAECQGTGCSRMALPRMDGMTWAFLCGLSSCCRLTLACSPGSHGSPKEEAEVHRTFWSTGGEPAYHFCRILLSKGYNKARLDSGLWTWPLNGKNYKIIFLWAWIQGAEQLKPFFFSNNLPSFPSSFLIIH